MCCNFRIVVDSGERAPITLTLNVHGSDTTGQQVKHMLSQRHPFIEHSENLNDYVLLFENELIANNHQLHDHHIISSATLNLVKINENIRKTLITKHEERERIAKRPSSRLMKLIFGYIRDGLLGIDIPRDICKDVLRFLGNKLPTFSVLIDTKTHRVSEKWLVKHLKLKLNLAPYNNIRYRGEVLKNYLSLEHYNVHRDTKAHLTYFCVQLYLRTPDGHILTLDLMERDYSLLEAKLCCQQQHNIQIESQQWVYNEHVLTDNTKSIKRYYQISRQSIVNLRII